MSNKLNDRLRAIALDGDAERYAYAAALLYYNSESSFRHIPWDLKYRRYIRQGRYFSRMLGNRLSQSPLFADVDMVIPVPLHWSRRLKRGYNQSEIIADEVARALGARMRTGILRRIRRTGTQTKVGVESKSANVSGAFAVHPSGIQDLRKARHVLLIDDTFTTGATLTACFAALRTVLPTGVRISCATLDYVTDS